MFLKRLTAVLALIIVALIFTTGCGSQNESRQDAAPTKQAPAAQVKTDLVIPEGDRKQIQTAAIILETHVFGDTEKRLTETITASGGMIESSQVSTNSDGRKNGRFVIRVPQEKLGQTVNSLSSLPDSKLLSRSVNAQDVTDEYIDINARVENLRLQEQRLRQLLEKASTVEEIMKIEGEITKVRTQLDSATGRLKNLSNRIALSTITATISETNTIQFDSYGGKLLTAFLEGFRAAGETLLVTITFIIGISPAIVIGYGLWRLWKFVRRKKEPTA